MAAITVKVQKIHCEACERTISHALGQLPGVRKVSPDRKSSEVRVLFDADALEEAAIRQRLEDAGYPPVA